MENYNAMNGLVILRVCLLALLEAYGLANQLRETIDMQVLRQASSSSDVDGFQNDASLPNAFFRMHGPASLKSSPYLDLRCTRHRLIPS